MTSSNRRGVFLGGLLILGVFGAGIASSEPVEPSEAGEARTRLHESAPSAAAALGAGSGSPAPRLVLLVVVDQLTRDRLDPSLPGGIGRLAREGRVYTEALIDHATTETCPGHIALASGRHPGAAGVPENSFYDPRRDESVYCVDDPASPVHGAPAEGRSPALLRVDTLGDWLVEARPGARVFSVSGKDRAAISLAGHRANAAYWYRYGESLGFTSSQHYMDALPAWVEEWNGSDPPRDGFVSRLPDRWLPTTAAGDPSERPDDFEAEWSEYGRAGAKTLRDEDRQALGERIFRSPFVDIATLSFARELVRREGIGRGPAPDLLAISLSANDTIGHLYGPESLEARDGLRRTDAALARFLEELEAELGRDRILIALSSDHGVLPLPEWLAATGRSTCPVEGGRSGLTGLGIGLIWRLHRELSPFFSWPAEWLHFSGYQSSVNRTLAAERGIAVERVVEVAERYLEAQPAVAEVWTREEVLTRSGPMAQLFRNSYDPERSGDLIIQLEATCLIYPFDEGTTHGSPYLYDRAVPIVLAGPGITPGRVPGEARTVDVAPTLAHLLGIPLPAGLDGRILNTTQAGADSGADPEVQRSRDR